MAAQVGFLNLDHCAAIAALLACLLVTLGCNDDPNISPERSEAIGSVSLDGTPLNGGTVTFRLIENPKRRVTTNIDSEGNFSVGNAPLGKVEMIVSTTQDIQYDPEVMRIPLKYEKYETSGLRTEISKEMDPLVIELKK